MRTQVIGDAEIDCPIVIADGIDEARELNAPGVYEAPGVFVVDNVDWNADMRFLQETLLDRERKFFKNPFSDIDIPPEIMPELEKAVRHINDLVRNHLYPKYDIGQQSWAWRPMYSFNEPMHFDTWVKPEPHLMGFLNLSDEPRVYNITYTFQGLCKRFPKEMLGVARACRKKNKQNYSYRLRENHWRKDRNPMKRNAPSLRIEFAPRSFWLFYPKTVSHQVVCAKGAISTSWPVANSAAEMQEQAIDRILGL